MQTASATTCPDCGQVTPTGGWVDQQGRVHHVGCGDPLGTKATTARVAELEGIIDEIYVELANAQDDLPDATWEAVKRIMGRA